jgi:hypothetical protein
MRVPSASHHLLVLCVQLVSDWTGGQRRLVKLVDVDRSVRAWRDPDWDGLLRTARRLDALRIVSMGLELPRQALGTPLPASIARGIEGCAPLRALVGNATAALFEESPALPDLGERLSLYWHLRERPFRRLADCLEIARYEAERPGARRPGVPWPARLLLHGSLRPAWQLWRYARRLGSGA